MDNVQTILRRVLGDVVFLERDGEDFVAGFFHGYAEGLHEAGRVVRGGICGRGGVGIAADGRGRAVAVGVAVGRGAAATAACVEPPLWRGAPLYEAWDGCGGAAVAFSLAEVALAGEVDVGCRL